MRTTTCETCGEGTIPVADECIIELDERSMDSMHSLLRGEVASLQCGKCGQATSSLPAIVVWTSRGTAAELLEGGPWVDGNPGEVQRLAAQFGVGFKDTTKKA